MVQTLQNVRCTKPKKKDSEEDRIKKFPGSVYGTNRVVAPEELPEMEDPAPGNESVNELHVNIIHQRKLYTDDTGRFPTKARSDNQYIMVAYHSSNVILVEPFASRKDKHRLAGYNIIMQGLKVNKLLIDLQILGNEYSKEYKEPWKRSGALTTNFSYLTLIVKMKTRDPWENSRLVSWQDWLE